MLTGFFPMFDLPFWLPCAEISLLGIAMIINFILLFIVATSQLQGVCRALFCTNVLAAILCATGQIAINVWIIANDRSLGREEFFFFPYVFIHQTGYYMCACSFLLILGERLLLCFKPSFYEHKFICFYIAFIVAIFLELLLTIPVVIAMQYQSLNITCSSFIAAQEGFTLLLLQMTKYQSRKYYRTKFATVNLNSRFEVRGVIDITTAILPICTLALSVKALFFVLAFFSQYGDGTFLSDAHFLLRLACIVYGYIYPLLLVTRVKTFRRRLFDLLPTSKVSFYEHTQYVEETAEVSTRKYFDQLSRQWKALFCTNVTAVLIGGVGQISIEVWIIHNGRSLGHDEFHFFPIVFIHQTGYFMCAVSFFLIIGERLLLCFQPGFYERRHLSFCSTFAAAIFIELALTIPLIIAMQYENLSVHCAAIVVTQEAISLMLLQLCKKKSRKHYATIFVKESLNARFEVKGVIELTTALIPICTSALAVKGLLFMLNFVSSFGEKNLVHDAHFLLRIASLIYGIIYPFILIFRVKTLRRRFSKFVPSSKIAIYLESSLVEESAETSTKRYFQHLSNQWNE